MIASRLVGLADSVRYGNEHDNIVCFGTKADSLPFFRQTSNPLGDKEECRKVHFLPFGCDRRKSSPGPPSLMPRSS